jgi:SAM-dependent methyltransferase
VLEIGSWIAPGQEAIVCRQTIAPLVGEYVGLDMQSGNGVDIVSDAKQMPFADEEFHIIISTDCYEHVDWPRDVTHEAYRVLKQGGVFYLTTVFDFQIHGYPDDFWRFTPNCIRLLLEDAGFDVVEVHGCGANDVRPGIVRGIGIKR